MSQSTTLRLDLWMPPHGGLAIGLERLTAQILGLPNIREATLYPRDRYRVTPWICRGVEVTGISLCRP